MPLNFSDRFNKILIISIKTLLFLTAFTPLIVTWKTQLPYMFGKVVFFRSAIEIVLILFLVYFFLNFQRVSQEIWEKIKKFFKTPLFIFVVLYVVFLAVSTIFAVDSYRAFWGTIDRGEGLFGILHSFVLMMIGLFLFKKKDWLNFFKIYLVSGLVLIFYAFLQFLKIYNFPFAIPFHDPRPYSFIGNPSFLATHMLFLIIFAITIIYETLQNKELTAKKNIFLRLWRFNFWRYFSFLMILLSVLVIFLTATRGAILGFGIGLLFLLFYLTIRRKGLWRWLSISFLIFLIIFSGIFWLTRHQPIWQKIPGFNRLAQTAILNVNDPSTQTRLITWQLSLKAFKEKPLFGWGPENYLVAYEKYYNPDFALYGETWLDRAHNKIFDLLVMQGLFGFLAYLGIFISAFYLMLKKKIPGKAFIMAALLAYFIQNLLIFDQLNSDIVFFIVLGFLIYSTTFGTDPAPFAQKESDNKRFAFPKIKTMLILAPLIVAAVGFIGYTVYADNYIPFTQSLSFKLSGSTMTLKDVLERVEKGMYPYNFAQYNIRGYGMDEFYLDRFFYNPDFSENAEYKPLADLLIEGMDELARKEPYDIRILLREVEMINGMTKVMTNEKETIPMFKKAEVLMREAVKRAPNRQEVYYHLAFNLAGQKRYEESIAEARYAVSLNSQVVRAHYHLGLMFALAGKFEDAEKEFDIVQQLDPNLVGLMTGDRNTMILVYDNQKKIDQVKKLIIKSLNGEIANFKFKSQYYEKALGYFAEDKDLDHFLQITDYLKTLAGLKEDMETLADFVKIGDWDVKYLYNGQGRTDKIAGLIIKSLDDKIIPHKFLRNHYEVFLGYFIHYEDTANSIKIAEYLMTFPEFKDNMEVIIDLLKKGNWTIIHNTLGV
jgi:O-antigen ligase